MVYGPNDKKNPRDIKKEKKKKLKEKKAKEKKIRAIIHVGYQFDMLDEHIEEIRNYVMERVNNIELEEEKVRKLPAYKKYLGNTESLDIGITNILTDMMERRIISAAMHTYVNIHSPENRQKKCNDDMDDWYKKELIKFSKYDDDTPKDYTHAFIKAIYIDIIEGIITAELYIKGKRNIITLVNRGTVSKMALKKRSYDGKLGEKIVVDMMFKMKPYVFKGYLKAPMGHRYQYCAMCRL